MAVSFVVCIITAVQAFIKLYDYNTVLANYSLIIIPLTFLVSFIFGSMQKINSISDAAPEQESGAPVPELCSDITFGNVSFAYNEDREVLKDISLNIPMGKVTAIIGGNGAGKSTVFKLLVRLYEPGEGSIKFGGEDISGYDLIAWRDRFAYVFRKEPLIGGTVRENMTYGLDREVSEAEGSPAELEHSNEYYRLFKKTL